MTVEELLPRLQAVRRTSRGYLARCPGHADKNPSLSIREAGIRILLRCFAGCETGQVVAALGLEMRDLFMDTATHRGRRSTPIPQKLDLAAVAFRFELGALDRRLRTEHVLQAIANFNSDELSELQRDRLMNAVAHAYAGRDRAEFLETVADNFRLKAFHERTTRHAA